MKKNLLLVMALTAIAFMISLAYLFILIQRKNALPPANTAVPVSPEIIPFNELREVSGTVQEIKDNTLVVQAYIYGQEKTYIIALSSGTKIQKRTIKDDIASPIPGEPIDPFIVSNASVGDIRENMTINIRSKENIIDKTSFMANEIYFDYLGF
jgi:hypothetical protein